MIVVNVLKMSMKMSIKMSGKIMAQKTNSNSKVNIRIGRMVARELGIKKCTRSDAEEIHDWIKNLDNESIQSLATKLDPQDALNKCVIYKSN